MKIAPRAEITEEFKEALREIYTSRLASYKENMKKAYSEAYRRNFYNNNKMKINKLITLLSDKKAFDFELTRLRSLSYTEYGIRVNAEGTRYLCAMTTPVKVQLKCRDNMRASMVTHNMGAYWVCTKLNFMKGIEGTKGQNFHFYPVADPLVEYRTPHHYGSHNNVSNTTHDPLDMGSNACLGGFNTIIYSAINCGDVTEYLRSAYIYLTRHNPNDALTSSYAYYFPWAVAV